MLPPGVSFAPQQRARAGPMTLADVEAPVTERVSTGVPGVDTVLGWNFNAPTVRGLKIPSFVLIAGNPGGGKSTLVLMVAARADVQTLYLTTEQTMDEIRETADRCCLTKKELGRIHAERVRSLSEAILLMRKWRSKIVIIDSINELTDPGPDTGDHRANITRYAIALKDEAEVHRRGILAVAQVKKDLDIFGEKRLEHACTALMRFDMHGDLRSLHCPEKNRAGRTGVKSWFRMTDQGLLECDAPPDPRVTKDA